MGSDFAIITLPSAEKVYWVFAFGGAFTDIALVVLDLRIPVDGGRRVAQVIRQQYGSGVPVLVMTAEHLTADAVTALGAVGYLRKPFDLDDVLAAVERSVPIDYGETRRQ